MTEGVSGVTVPSVPVVSVTGGAQAGSLRPASPGKRRPAQGAEHARRVAWGQRTGALVKQAYNNAKGSG